jgi:hypothetical protein
MAGKNGFTAKQFIDAIPGTGGVITTIAARVGCTWQTAKKYIVNYPTIFEAYENESHKIDDAAKSNVIGDIINKKSIETSKWWLRVKLPDEFAPAEKRDLRGAGDDGAIVFRVVRD